MAVGYIYHAQCTSATTLAIQSLKVESKMNERRAKGTVTLFEASTVDRFEKMGVSHPILIQLFQKAVAADQDVEL